MTSGGMVRMLACLAVVALVSATSWAGDATGTERPFLGVSIDSSGASNFDDGIPVTVVTPNSTAAGIGLAPGDFLLAINHQPLHKLEDLQKVMAATKVGDEVIIDYKHGTDKPVSKVATLKAKPPPPNPVAGQLVDLQTEIDKLRLRSEHEPSLPELLDDLTKKLDDLEKSLPKAADAFKKQYPNGDFSISLSINITSDRNAKEPMQLGHPKDAGDPTVPKDGDSKDPKGTSPTGTPPKDPVRTSGGPTPPPNPVPKP